MKKIFLVFSMISLLFVCVSCSNSSGMAFQDYGESVTEDYFDYELDLVINSFEFYVADAELVYEYKGQEETKLTSNSEYCYKNLAIDIGSGVFKEINKTESTQKYPNSTVSEKTKTERIYQHGSSSNEIYLVNLLTKTKIAFSNDSIKNIYESNIAKILKNSYSTYSYLLEQGTTNYYYNKSSKTLTLVNNNSDNFTNESYEYRYQIKYVDDNFSIKIYYEESSIDYKNIYQTSIIFHHKNISLSKVNLDNYKLND